MKVRITFYKEKTGKTTQKEYPSLKAASLAVGRAPRLLSHKMKFGGLDITTNNGSIISIEALDGKTDNAPRSVREHSDQPKENIPLGTVEVHGGGGWFQQAVGKVTAAVYWCLSKFN